MLVNSSSQGRCVGFVNLFFALNLRFRFMSMEFYHSLLDTNLNRFNHI